VAKGSLAVVADWLDAVNRQDTARVTGLTTADEVTGTR
jgi:hypothetical protein